VVRLITGQAFVLRGPSSDARSGLGTAIMPMTGEPATGGGGGGGGGEAPGSLVTMRRDGRSYAIPAAALPYLGHGLDPSLFDVGALQRAGKAAPGRLTISIRYSGNGARPAPVPGITITSAAHGQARGYLTAASEKKFGRALDRQFAADYSRASYGTDGLFAGGLTISLPGRNHPTATRTATPTRPQYQMHTLTVTGNYRDGRPDTGDLVMLANVDNSGRLDFIDSMAPFFHGIAKFSVPAGHYFAIGFFFGSSSGGVPFPTTHGLDLVPQFTVAANTRLRLNERAASSRITMVTPRPASVRDTAFVIFRRPRTGPFQSFGFANFRWLGGNAPIWVSPTGKASKRPSIGSMATVVDQRLAGPAHAAPYEYDLAYQNLTGLIPPQRYVVRAASLAVIKARYYLARHGGFLSRVSNFPIQQGSLAFSYDPANVPGTRTIYSSAGPDLIWITSLYTAAGPYPGTLLQTDPARSYRPGQQVIENWNAYPLHPTPQRRRDRLGRPAQRVRDDAVRQPVAQHAQPGLHPVRRQHAWPRRRWLQ
jgi:hypothetical protein